MTSKPLIIATQTNGRVSATSVWFLIFRCWQFLCVLIFVGGGLTQCLSASTPAALQLSAGAQVDSRGVFLGQLVKSDQPLPSLRLCDAPAFGKTTELTRAQVNDLLATAASGLVTTNWTGADTVEISRRTRTLSEMDALDLLTSTLQKSYAKDRGDLELNFTQPWDAPTVPDEPLTVKVLELPAEGIESAFIIRFELRTATETVGTWQAPLQAHLWRNVWVAHSDLKRGELASDADVDQERRDVLGIRESLAQLTGDNSSLQFSDSVQAGNILLTRDLKPRTVIYRGQMADALLQDGALNIMVKVEVLEDGALGQIVRVRNPVSLRSLSAKVVNDQTVSISL
jgi:flagella basal body P-ring formation protein FlgA